MQTFKPNLDLLRQALGPHIQGCHAELIKTTLRWSLVYRVTLEINQGHSTRENIIVKATNPNGPIDALEAERELLFYQRIYPKLSVPKPYIYHLGTDQASGWHLIVMDDLTCTYRFPKHPYQWTRAELRSVLWTYAILHTLSFFPSRSDLQWLNPRHESQLYFDSISEQVAIVQRAGIWEALPELPSLIAFANQSCQRYESAALTLLHNDTTPTNVALPKDLDSQPAILIDWQDVGIGMAEMDLAYLDLQPFNSARFIPRSELLSTYWQFRAEIEGEIPPPDERANRQLHADLVMALWLTRPASRVALHPYPEGSYPRMHWDSQYAIVYNRLKALGHEIQ